VKTLLWFMVLLALSVFSGCSGSGDSGSVRRQRFRRFSIRRKKPARRKRKICYGIRKGLPDEPGKAKEKGGKRAEQSAGKTRQRHFPPTRRNYRTINCFDNCKPPGRLQREVPCRHRQLAVAGADCFVGAGLALPRARRAAPLQLELSAMP